MSMTGIDEIGMNLVRNDDHTVFHADVAEPGQLIPRPDPSHWIVGTAQKEQFDSIFDDLASISS